MPESMDARGRQDAATVNDGSVRVFRDCRDSHGTRNNATGSADGPLAERGADCKCGADCKSGHCPYNRDQQHPPRLSTMRTLGGYFFRGWCMKFSKPTLIYKAQLDQYG